MFLNIIISILYFVIVYCTAKIAIKYFKKPDNDDKLIVMYASLIWPVSLGIALILCPMYYLGKKIL